MLSYSLEKSLQFSRAVKEGNLQLVQILSLDPEVNHNLPNSDGWTPFYWACVRAHVDVVRYLLNFKHPAHVDGKQSLRAIDYNLRDNYGGSPFLTACSSGREEVVEILVKDKRIDINRPSEDGRTPLWWAACVGFVVIVKIILASGREIEGEKLSSAREIANCNECDEIAECIEDYQRNPDLVRLQLQKELGYSHGEPTLFSLFVLSFVNQFFFLLLLLLLFLLSSMNQSQCG